MLYRQTYSTVDAIRTTMIRMYRIGNRDEGRNASSDVFFEIQDPISGHETSG